MMDDNATTPTSETPEGATYHKGMTEAEKREMDTAEIRAMLYILPGKGPMTFEELKEYNKREAELDAAAEVAMAQEITDENAVRAARLAELASGETAESGGGV